MSQILNQINFIFVYCKLNNHYGVFVYLNAKMDARIKRTINQLKIKIHDDKILKQDNKKRKYRIYKFHMPMNAIKLSRMMKISEHFDVDSNYFEFINLKEINIKNKIRKACNQNNGFFPSLAYGISEENELSDTEDIKDQSNITEMSSEINNTVGITPDIKIIVTNDDNKNMALTPNLTKPIINIIKDTTSQIKYDNITTVNNNNKTDDDDFDCGANMQSNQQSIAMTEDTQGVLVKSLSDLILPDDQMNTLKLLIQISFLELGSFILYEDKAILLKPCGNAYGDWITSRNNWFIHNNDIHWKRSRIHKSMINAKIYKEFRIINQNSGYYYENVNDHNERYEMINDYKFIIH
jgi:hypothetical protein